MLSELKLVRNHHVSDKLKNLPKGLVETYTTILNRNIREEERQEARFLLLNMVAAHLPLKRKGIAAAFALWKKGIVLPNESLEDYTDICSSCGSIIYVANTDDDATVNFCHQSAKKFLLNNRSGSSEVWFHTSLDGANLLMFEMWWDCLSDEELGNGSLAIRCENGILLEADMKDLEPDCQRYPFLNYASNEGGDHAIASYPVVLNGFKFDIGKPPTLCDAWLLRTVEEGQLDVLKLLQSNRADLNMRKLDGMTPLSWLLAMIIQRFSSCCWPQARLMLTQKNSLRRHHYHTQFKMVMEILLGCC